MSDKIELEITDPAAIVEEQDRTLIFTGEDANQVTAMLGYYDNTPKDD